MHNGDYGATEYNPGVGQPTRFAPLVLPNGKSAPTMYAAVTRDAAIAETVFHDVDPSIAGSGIYVDDLDNQLLCRLVFLRNLRLGDLTPAGLAALHLPDDALVHGPPTDYAATAAWALALHQWRRNRPRERLDGLQWESRLAGPALCFLLFGDRIPRALVRSSKPMPLGTGKGYNIVAKLADKRGIAVYE